MIILDDIYKIEMKEKAMNKMTKVIKYLKENERSLSWLARKCDVSPTTAHYWAIGKNSPTNKHKVLIKEITGIKL
tara:strand:- start:5678 stop:5902 length:225 start_codon:yes stop_codon:yes gene_type:complete